MLDEVFDMADLLSDEIADIPEGYKRFIFGEKYTACVSLPVEEKFLEADSFVKLTFLRRVKDANTGNVSIQSVFVGRIVGSSGLGDVILDPTFKARFPYLAYADVKRIATKVAKPKAVLIIRKDSINREIESQYVDSNDNERTPGTLSSYLSTEFNSEKIITKTSDELLEGIDELRKSYIDEQDLFEICGMHFKHARKDLLINAAWGQEDRKIFGLEFPVGSSVALLSDLEHSLDGAILRSMLPFSIFKLLATIMMFGMRRGFYDMDWISVYTCRTFTPMMVEDEILTKDMVQEVIEAIDQNFITSFFERKQYFINSKFNSSDGVPNPTNLDQKQFINVYMDSSKDFDNSINFCYSTNSLAQSSLDNDVVGFHIAFRESYFSTFEEDHLSEGCAPDDNQCEKVQSLATFRAATSRVWAHLGSKINVIANREANCIACISFAYMLGVHFTFAVSQNSRNIGVVEASVDAFKNNSPETEFIQGPDLTSLRVEREWEFTDERGMLHRKPFYLYLYLNEIEMSNNRLAMRIKADEMTLKYQEALASASLEHISCEKEAIIASKISELADMGFSEKVRRAIGLSLSIEEIELIRDGLLSLATNDKFVITPKAVNKCMIDAINLLATSYKATCKQVYLIYNHRDHIKWNSPELEQFELHKRRMIDGYDEKWGAKLFISMLTANWYNLLMAKVKAYNESVVEEERISLLGNSLISALSNLDMLYAVRISPDTLIPCSEPQPLQSQLLRLCCFDSVLLQTLQEQRALALNKELLQAKEAGLCECDLHFDEEQSDAT